MGSVVAVKKYNILITAMGGDVGQSIAKALRLGSLPVILHGSDANKNGVGGAFVDYMHTLPLARDTAEYFDALNGLVETENIDVVIPASEVEIAAAGLHADRLLKPGRLLMQSKEWIDSYADKLTVMRQLRAKEIQLAAFADASSPEEVLDLTSKVKFPVVVKSRKGFGSKTVGYANNEIKMQELIRQLSPAVVMEYIPDDGGEFSVGAFRSGNHCIVLPVKRSLGPVGCTWYGEVAIDEDVVSYAKSIAEASALQGAANIQVRKNNNGVFLLEINPRLSSLSAARAAAGFNDAEWWVRMLLGLPIEYPLEYCTLKFQRYFGEMIDVGSGWECPRLWSPKNIK